MPEMIAAGSGTEEMVSVPVKFGAVPRDGE